MVFNFSNWHAGHIQTIFLVGCLATASATAETSNVTSTETEPEVDQVENKSKKTTSSRRRIRQDLETGWTLLLGLGAGSIAESNVDAPPGHQPHKGTAFTASVMAGRYSQKLAYDFGLGWSYSKLSGKEPDIPTGIVVDAIVATQAAYLIGAARYRVTRRFEVGASLMQMAGGDLSFSSYDATPRSATFLGVDLVGLQATRQRILRGRLSYQFDLTVPKRSVRIISLGVDFGLPLLKNDEIIRKKTILKTKTIRRNKQRTVTEDVEVQLSVLKSTLDKRMIVFSGNDSDPNQASTAYLKELGSAIKSVSDKFKFMVVAVNMSAKPVSKTRLKIAAKRAAGIAKLFELAGLDAKKIKTRGVEKKELLPVGKTPSLEVELYFVDATDSTPINAALEKVKRRFNRPDTCSGGDCR